MVSIRYLILLVIFLVGLFPMGCTGLSRPPEHLVRNPNGTYTGPGSPKWWDHNKSRAEFVVGQGYRVPGVPGFFDDRGRPISDPVAPTDSDQDHQDGFLGGVVPDKAYTQFKTAIGQGPDADAARALFEEARQLYDRKEYVAAAEKFQDAADRWPGSNLQEEAMFMVGEGYFFADKYADANDAYEALIKKYSGSKFLDKAIARQWLIARYWQQKAEQDPEWSVTPNLIDKTRPLFDTRGRAMKIYDNIRLNDPTGPWSDEALMATASSHFARGRYEDADYHFGILRREYPKSDHQLMAHFLGLQSKIRKYQGPEYDSTPLDEAEQLIQQLKMQFGSQLSAEERQRVDEIDAQIAHHRALRDWKMAQYYEKGDHYGAARFYYTRIATKYPTTKMGESAQARLAEINDRPDSPPERLSWLIEMFPEDKERKEMDIEVADESLIR